MVSHDYKYVFIHVPKTGGTSITKALKPKRSPRHVPLCKMKRKENGNYFKFAFVRNPWDRVVSSFFFRQKRKWLTKESFEDRFGEPLTFKNWVKQKEYTTSFANQGNRLYLQVNWMKYRCSEKFGMDYIGRFENLQSDFDAICDKIGIPRKQLKHRNATRHEHYTEYYDDETRDIVGQLCAEDIEYFGYKFGA